MVDIAKSNSHSSLSSPLSRILHLPFNSKVAEPNGRRGGSSQNEEEGGREENIFCSSSSSDLLACMISRQASFPPPYFVRIRTSTLATFVTTSRECTKKLPLSPCLPRLIAPSLLLQKQSSPSFSPFSVLFSSSLIRENK